MKRCPTCQRTFTEQHLTFCVDDGTPLVAEESSDEVTRVSSSVRQGEGNTADANARRSAPAYQAPGSYRPPDYGAGSKRKAWPWILGLLALVFLVFIGLGLAAIVFVPRFATNRGFGTDNNNVNVNRNDSTPQSNLNSNANVSEETANDNDNSETDESTPPPTDQEVVLADLKNLEDEWTVANINADKKKLNRILADDYVGITEGRAQGKAEYLKTIRPDTAIQRWEFENLKVTLNGDRASLSGILRLDFRDQKGQDQQAAYRFIDKFVWREGRWQATSSEVEPVKPGTAV